MAAHSQVRDPYYQRQVEDRLRDQVREMYRAHWNVPSRRRVLAHVPSLMIWGSEEVEHPDRRKTTHQQKQQQQQPEGEGEAGAGAGGQEVSSGGGGDATAASASPTTAASSSSEVVTRVCREVYWEYQRQLWMPEFSGKGGTDEFHFHRFGRVGIVFVDVLAERLGPRGRERETRGGGGGGSGGRGGPTLVGPRQLRFVNDTVLPSQDILTLVVVAPCAPNVLPPKLVRPLMRWRNTEPVPTPRGFARQLLFVGGGRRARKPRMGMFAPVAAAAGAAGAGIGGGGGGGGGGGSGGGDAWPVAPLPPPEEAGSAFMLSTGSVAGRPRDIAFGVVHCHANLHSAWVERWVEPARAEQPKAVVTVGPVVGALDATSVVILFEADKAAPAARVVLIDVVTGVQQASTPCAVAANRPRSVRVAGLKPGRRYIVYVVLRFLS